MRRGEFKLETVPKKKDPNQEPAIQVQPPLYRENPPADKFDNLGIVQSNSQIPDNLTTENSADNSINIQLSDRIGNEDDKSDSLQNEEQLFTQDDFEDTVDDQSSCLSSLTTSVQEGLESCFTKNKRLLKICFTIIAVCLYGAYFIWSCSCRFESEDDIRLVWVTAFVIFCVIAHFITEYAGHSIYKGILKPINSCIKKNYVILKWLSVAVVSILIIFYLIYFVALKDSYNLVSLIGIFVYVLIGYLCSSNPKRVRWRPILGGLLLQFIFALIILRTRPGFMAFNFLGDRISEFLKHADAGSKFVFGDLYLNHFFAFKVLPVIIFFSSTISVLYYIGVMQMVITKVAWVMQICLGTTAGESLNAAGNIFLGMTESPLMIRPFIGKMTNSELHAVVTCGFATIAGSVLAAYISFGVPADHLLSASVMSAPAALAMSKLFYPETKKSKTTAKDISKMAPSPHKNIVEAISVGASESIILIANIAVNLIAFLAILSFINATLTWFGDRACLAEPLTFQLICSYVLWPLAVVMGVEIKDCRLIGELIGVKTFLNEFIAYDELGKLITNRKMFETFNSTIANITYTGRNMFIEEGERNATLVKGFLSMRSEVIATYTLCGFANFGSIGVMLSSLGAMAPHRRRDLSSLMLRALVAGNIACFLTACISGLFYEKEV